MANMVSLIADGRTPPMRVGSSTTCCHPMWSASWPVRLCTNPVACGRARTEEHSGDRHVQTNDARKCESGEPRQDVTTASRQFSGCNRPERISEHLARTPQSHGGDRRRIGGVRRLLCCPFSPFWRVLGAARSAYAAVALASRQRVLFNTALLGMDRCLRDGNRCASGTLVRPRPTSRKEMVRLLAGAAAYAAL